MNIYNFCILVKGEDKTQEIESCTYIKGKGTYQVVYVGNPQIWTYGYSSIKWLKNPITISSNTIIISHNGIPLFDIERILEFGQHWRIFFKNKKVNSYHKSSLKIDTDLLSNINIRNYFDYFKEIADRTYTKKEDSKNQLAEQYKKITYISDETVLSLYLRPDKKFKGSKKQQNLYYPFGCNISQMQAVERALSNRISVIEGPPGTGKTQTILNIIANVFMQGNTVAVVSNNNSATDNVYEKLDKNGYGFIAATLGNFDNKKEFIENKQSGYPDFQDFIYDINLMQNIKGNTEELQNELKDMLNKQNRIAELQSQVSAIKLEKKYFDEYYSETYNDNLKVRNKFNLKSKKVLDFWIECQTCGELQKDISLWFKLKSVLIHGIFNMNFYKKPIQDVIPAFQNLYYELKIKELEHEIKMNEDNLRAFNFKEKMDKMIENSKVIFKNSLYENYKGNSKRRTFLEEDLFKNSYEFMKEYPVVLSTTHSIKNCMKPNYVYDYIIVDEASQVDLKTGILALSCARNIVIVGDLMQLPNVINQVDRRTAKAISDAVNISDCYRYEKHSLLSSVCEVFQDVPRTLLREHYRCHPKIIGFCNEKFYHNNLIIMTEDHMEKDVLKVHKTVAGNHARGHFNQRQIDEIKAVVIPELKTGKEQGDIGIIAPYNDQTVAIKGELIDGVEVSTVHKFQGREKDNIIISTVDNEITEFTDNPNMLNVAVSRAKNRLRLVVCDNESNENTNIGDLIKYIEYNNFEVVRSDIYSVFDLIYADYTQQRNKYLEKHNKVSEFDSENLMYSLIQEVLMLEQFEMLRVIVHQPLNMLIRNPEKLTDEECKYAMNCATHLDFLIYNKLNKVPVLAVEVDGYKYHKKGTRQAERDKMKDLILEKYSMPLLRFKTNGSGENETLVRKLEQLLEIKKDKYSI